MYYCEPIGYYLYYNNLFTKDTLPRQPEGSHLGYIELEHGKNYEMALSDLDQFSHIWLLFWFHSAKSWRPKVLPPKTKVKRGLFATRSPHRPNPIGLSCVRLKEVRGRILIVEGADLLDGTPILDIKPYIPYADCQREASTGWLPTEAPLECSVIWSEKAKEKAQWLCERGVDLCRQVERALSSTGIHPSPSNRIVPCSISAEERWYIKAYRTWRLYMRVEAPSHMTAGQYCVFIDSVVSGYEPKSLQLGEEDPWNDKDLHRQFIEVFPDSAR